MNDMMYEITPLDICNLALSKLGESPIPAIDPNGSPAARQCYLHYHPTRREVLCAHRWTFAQKLTELTSSEAQDPNQSEHLIYHSLPADCLRVLSVNQNNWALRGRGIYSKDSGIKLLYTYDCEDSEQFEPLFIEALATRLAFKMCISLTSSTTARSALLEEYKKIALPEAAHFNAVQSASNDTHPLYQLWKNRQHD
ncbi:MAG: hypothetical protein R3Y56_03140 [Akkermansia sp.]